MAPKPNKDDVSRADRAGDYGYKKQFYQSQAVAEDYNFHRWGTPERAERNLRKWKTILEAISMTGGIRTVLDVPCGTGRFIGSCSTPMSGSPERRARRSGSRRETTSRTSSAVWG